MVSRSLLSAGVCGAALILAASSAGAQTAAAASTPAPAENATSGQSIDEIIVTARKRAENVQDVPISITAVTGATIQNQGVRNLKDFSNFVPGVNINNGRADGGGTTAQIFIRGVGQNDFLMPNEPGVGLYVDDIYVASSSGALDSLGDTQSVEVLRGPQGTLYGKNTIGGAIRITTTKPDFDTLSGNVSLTGGSYHRIDVSGGINIPISDTLAVRFSAASKNTDDLQKRYLDPNGEGQGNINQDAIRGVLRWKPSSRFDMLISADYTRIRQHMGYGGNSQYIPGASVLVDVLNAQYYPTINAQLGLPASARFDSRWATGTGASGATGPNADHYDVWGVSAVMTYDLTPDIAIKSISAVRGVKGFAGRDGDGSPYPLLETVSTDDNKQFSQELQINGSSFDNRLKWTTGLYYMHQNLTNSISTKLWNGLVNTTVNLDFDARSLGKLSGDTYAIFGQGTFDITPSLHLTVGGRYNIEKRDFQNRWFFLVQPRAFTCPGVDVTGTFIQCKSTDKVFTPAASLAYDITQDVMVYASYSQGFKVGGWTPRLFSQTSLKRYLPEKLKAYELGLKTSWFDRRLTFNIDVFQSDYTNLQLTSVLADASGAPQPVVQNAGAARIRGLESELTARIGTGTKIQAGLSYLDGEYRQLDASVSFPITNKLPETPKLSLTGSIEQAFYMESGASLTFRADGVYRSLTYKDPNNVEAVAQRPYALLNGRISYRMANEKVTFSVFGTNLTDKRYVASGTELASTFGLYEIYYGRPREFGAEIAVKF
jgi:iron complex outermembrane receptor protein